MNKNNYGRQKGWTLLEAAVAVALIGLISVTVLTSIKVVEGGNETVRQNDFLLRAEAALAGSVIQGNFHLPPPLDAIPSPKRPGYIEGWLPNSLLGLQSSKRVRYLVDESLISKPTAIYEADPLQLSDGLIMARSQINGLDFCMTVMKNEMAGTALPNGMRAAFVLQEVLSTGKLHGDVNSLWLAGDSSDSAPENVQLETLSSGYLEFLENLGCLQKFSQLSVGTKATAVQAELVKLAGQTVELERLQLISHNQALDSSIHQLANRSLTLTSFAIDAAVTGLQMAMDYGAIPLGILKLTGTSANIVGTSVLIASLKKTLDSQRKNIVKTQAAIETSVAYEKELQALLATTAAKTNRDQIAGLNP